MGIRSPRIRSTGRSWRPRTPTRGLRLGRRRRGHAATRLSVSSRSAGARRCGLDRGSRAADRCGPPVFRGDPRGIGVGASAACGVDRAQAHRRYVAADSWPVRLSRRSRLVDIVRRSTAWLTGARRWRQPHASHRRRDRPRRADPPTRPGVRGAPVACDDEIGFLVGRGRRRRISRRWRCAKAGSRCTRADATDATHTAAHPDRRRTVSRATARTNRQAPWRRHRRRGVLSGGALVACDAFGVALLPLVDCPARLHGGLHVFRRHRRVRLPYVRVVRLPAAIPGGDAPLRPARAMAERRRRCHRRVTRTMLTPSLAANFSSRRRRSRRRPSRRLAGLRVLVLCGETSSPREDDLLLPDEPRCSTRQTPPVLVPPTRQGPPRPRRTTSRSSRASASGCRRRRAGRPTTTSSWPSRTTTGV